MKTHGDPGTAASATHDAGAASSNRFSGEVKIARSMAGAAR
jgi:hypothetical protein